MKKIGIYVAVMLSLIGAWTANLCANPLPSCDDEWCHYTGLNGEWLYEGVDTEKLDVEPNLIYHDFEELDFEDFDLEGLFDKERNEWMAANCPNWPDANDPVFRALPNWLDRIHWDYNDAINELWEEKHPTESCCTYDGQQEKLREEMYLADQKERYGQPVPFCLTEKAQSRVEQERRETEKYLQDAPNVPMVRDRVVLLAKIEEANAKTAQEQGLENLYKKPQAWEVDKATMDSWWAETHPNGKPLDKQAIKQRYKDYFIKQAWKQENPNADELSIEELREWGRQRKIQEEQAIQKAKETYNKRIQEWWDLNYPEWPAEAIDDSMGDDREMFSAYDRYKEDVNELWLMHHPQERRVPSNCINCPDKFSVPFEEREQYYINKQKEMYGENIPHCLTKEEQARRHEYKIRMEEYVNDPETGNREYFERQLQYVVAAERASERIAAKFNLKNRLRLTSSAVQSHISSRVSLLLVGLVAAVITGFAVIVLFKRKKNMSK